MQHSISFLALFFIACSPPVSVGGNGGRQGADAGPIANQDAGEPAPDSGRTPPDPSNRFEPGTVCDCSDECWGSETNPGICVKGICMQEAAGACAESGSRGECDERSRCWSMEGLEGSICWPDCDAYNCEGTCDNDGSCVPTADTSCDSECSDYCGNGGATTDRCDNVTCPEGSLCNPADGQCIESDQGLPAGSPPNCVDEIPALNDCDPNGGANSCHELIQFDPPRAQGYWDYPLNGERENDQYRSWARRDLMLLIRRATAATKCLSEDWEHAGYQDLGLGDMSEQNGDIPGTRENRPGHPAGTHVNGHDMDIAYYQIGQSNNWLRPVCEHVQNGEDQYHCVGQPVTLDVYRTALFIGRLHDSPNLRVIGVDGKIGPLVRSAIVQLCGAGWLRNSACNQLRMAYEETDLQQGWYRFHHHHLHISLSSPG
ncbi:MAG: hypothetical protein OSB21_10525 [Myxococcota bacterium]|nr:hypothetical protein [Myxococcota bacterium]